MKCKKPFLVPVTILILILIPGCKTAAKSTQVPINLQSPIPPSPTSVPTILTDDGITIGTNTNCPDRAAFGEVTENIPANGALITNNPILFRWYYAASEGAAPDWASVCVPTSFTLYLAPAPDYNITHTYSITPTTADNLTNLLMYSYYLSDTLQPFTTYRWMVVGHAAGIDIGQDKLPLFQDDTVWSPSNPGSLLAMNQYSMSGEFQTGPGCDANTINSVDLLEPPVEAILNSDTPVFRWDMPNCSARAYRITFDTDPQMGSIVNGWVTAQEWFQMISGNLQPCILYYWRVQAGIYSASYHMQSGNWATASDVRSFIIQDASCPNAQAVPTSTPTPRPTVRILPTNTPKKITPTPDTCTSYTDQATCEAHSDICRWYKVNDTISMCIPKE